MTILAFDCAVSGLGVAVVRDDVCLAQQREEGRGQAATLAARDCRRAASRPASIAARCR